MKCQCIGLRSPWEACIYSPENDEDHAELDTIGDYRFARFAPASQAAHAAYLAEHPPLPPTPRRRLFRRRKETT